MFKVILDPGHGGKDPGAVNGSIFEKVLNLVVCLLIKFYLKPYPIEVVLTRDKDITLDPEPRVAIVNKSKADLCVSIHFNMYLLGTIGVEAFCSVFAKPGNAGHKLSALAAEHIAAYTDIANRGIGQRWNAAHNKDYYFMIRNTKMTSIITEGDFISDTPRVTSKEFQEGYAKGVARSIVEYFGMKWDENKPILLNVTAEQLPAFAAIPSTIKTYTAGDNLTAKSEKDNYYELDINGTKAWINKNGVKIREE